MLPLGCFPLWGREGVILQAAAENERIETKEHFYRANNSLKKEVQLRYFSGFFPSPIKNRIGMWL
jgi:hypothetical protein